MFGKFKTKSKTIASNLFRSKPIPTDQLFIGNYPQLKQVFFVVGHPKSGTTWMSKLLNSHPEVCCKFEGHFFQRDDGFLSLHNALSKENSSLLHRWLGAKFNLWTKDADDILIFQKLIIQFYLQKEAALSKKKIVGDKSPSYQISQIKELFPNAKVIHMVRDGRDVVTSMAYHRSKDTERYMTKDMADRLDSLIDGQKSRGSIKRILPKDYIERIAGTWKEEVNQCRKDGTTFFGKNFIEIKYEDLKERPEQSLIEVYKLLGVERIVDSEIRNIIKTNSFSKITGREEGDEGEKITFNRKGIIGDWKNHFEEESIEIFNQIAGLEMKNYNYI